MESILEELSVAIFARVWRFHFDKHGRGALRSEKCIINSTFINGVLSPNSRRIKNVPTKIVKGYIHNGFANVGFVPVAIFTNPICD